MGAGKVVAVSSIVFALIFGSTMLLGSAKAACPPDACAVTTDQLALAQELVTANQQGRLRFLETRYLQQVVDIAAGRTVPHCGIDVRVLQLMVIAVRTYESVGVSDLNRMCTGDTIADGGHFRDIATAVDFYAFNGRPTTGADANALKFLALLDPIVPPGARAGQSQCRNGAETRVTFANFTDFPDTCNHLHLDFAKTDRPLLIGN